PSTPPPAEKAPASGPLKPRRAPEARHPRTIRRNSRGSVGKGEASTEMLAGKRSKTSGKIDVDSPSLPDRPPRFGILRKIFWTDRPVWRIVRAWLRLLSVPAFV